MCTALGPSFSDCSPQGRGTNLRDRVFDSEVKYWRKDFWKSEELEEITGTFPKRDFFSGRFEVVPQALNPTFRASIHE